MEGLEAFVEVQDEKNLRFIDNLGRLWSLNGCWDSYLTDNGHARSCGLGSRWWC